MTLLPGDAIYALLAMDAYNQGIGVSVPGVDAPYPKLGLALPDGSESVGFSATAYDVNGKSGQFCPT
ncbi:hypothetical protein [Labrenzia sp. CE80]|uniref:hypothetical protein n=1 Tax=Labrenzia sp. CE80 TaxID=1788986 RepID=UPI00129AD1AE|nr:hypothetical protein [Labrenzia sp. CE80]